MSSPLSSKFSNRNAPQVASPYLSESAHVLSLQQPVGKIEAHCSSESGAMTIKSDEATVKSGGDDTTSIATRLDAQQPTSQPSAPSIHSRRSNLSKIDDYFLIPPGIGSQPQVSERVKEETQGDDSEVQGPEEAEVSCDPIVIVPRISIWSRGLGKTGSRLKDELQQSKFTRKLFKGPRSRSKPRLRSICSITKSRRSSGGTNKMALLDSSHSINSSFKTANSQFPGNEAVRVSTPPIDEDTADGKPRGFFTSLAPPESNADIAPSPTPSSPRLGPSAHHHRCQRISLSAQPREWWDPMPAPRIRRQQTPAPQDFEFDVPEHLPSSPLSTKKEARVSRMIERHQHAWESSCHQPISSPRFIVDPALEDATADVLDVFLSRLFARLDHILGDIYAK
ncbi:hypothetical protein C2857_006766 [Epichloe festucae Fl1]|uniref:Uncharacterized protein n=1 Tax=Epichloe festucae (strain Fl1) TaxID=877507 RepID=A0A7S9KLY4_EPIFF|nr:hypothetical protein C2857_006766 [Epichloe festucae Fl1]